MLHLPFSFCVCVGNIQERRYGGCDVSCAPTKCDMTT